MSVVLRTHSLGKGAGVCTAEHDVTLEEKHNGQKEGVCGAGDIHTDVPKLESHWLADSRFS